MLITSRMGSVADNTSGASYGYRMSKAALNIAVRVALPWPLWRGLKAITSNLSDMPNLTGQEPCAGP